MTTPEPPAGRDNQQECTENHCHGKRRGRAGGLCHRPAGWGTTHAGTGRCKLHGGSTVTHRVSAANEQAKAVIEQYRPSGGILGNPVTALLQLAQEFADLKDYLAAKVAELDPERWAATGVQGEQIRAIVAAYERALDRTAKVLVDINKLDLEARLVKLQERIEDAQAAVIFAGVERALGEIGLTVEQRERFPDALRRHMEAIRRDAA